MTCNPKPKRPSRSGVSGRARALRWVGNADRADELSQQAVTSNRQADSALYAMPKQLRAEMRPKARHSPRLPPPLYMLHQMEPNSPAL